METRAKELGLRERAASFVSDGHVDSVFVRSSFRTPSDLIRPNPTIKIKSPNEPICVSGLPIEINHFGHPANLGTQKTNPFFTALQIRASSRTQSRQIRTFSGLSGLKTHEGLDLGLWTLDRLWRNLFLSRSDTRILASHKVAGMTMLELCPERGCSEIQNVKYSE